jgi:hypothetical protein
MKASSTITIGFQRNPSARMGEDVKGHEGRRVLGGEGGDLSWRVDKPVLQEVDVEPGAVPDDRFTVEDGARLELIDRCCSEIRGPVGQVLALT